MSVGKYKVENPGGGKRLKYVLKQAGITQNELAERLHCARNHISMIVTGKRRLTADMAIMICDIVPGTSVAYLLGIEETRHDYTDLCNRLRNGTRLPAVQALMTEAADAIEELTARLEDNNDA